jgi:hypothetical protein
MNLSRALILALSVLLVSLSAAADEAVTKALPGPNPPAPAQADLLAGLAKAPDGWQIAEAPAAFHDDDLWKWIDGEATQILEYQFDYALKVTYSNGKARIEVGIFVAKTPLDAFGIFSRERTPSSKSAPVVNSSFFDGTQLHVWRNYAYVRFLPDKTDPSVRPVVRDLADKVCKLIEPATVLPSLLTLLPTEGLVPGSVAYFRANALGSADLGNAVTVQYTPAGGKRVTLWVFAAKDEAAAGKVMTTLAALLGKQSAVPDLGDEAFRGTADAYGPTLVMRQAQFVAAVFPATQQDFAQALLRRLSVRIEVCEAGGQCRPAGAF